MFTERVNVKTVMLTSISDLHLSLYIFIVWNTHVRDNESEYKSEYNIPKNLLPDYVFVQECDCKYTRQTKLKSIMCSNKRQEERGPKTKNTHHWLRIRWSASLASLQSPADWQEDRNTAMIPNFHRNGNDAFLTCEKNNGRHQETTSIT